MDEIQSLAGRCRVAMASQAVSKNECVFTFYNPFSSPEGIVVNLNTFVGTIQSLAFAGGSDNPSSSQEERDIFLRIVKQRVEKPQPMSTTDSTTDDDETAPAPPAAPTKLAIGVEGGFSLSPEDDKYETITTYSVVVLANSGSSKPTTVVAEVHYDMNDDTIKSTFPMMVSQSVDSIIHHVGMSVQQDLTAWQDDEVIPVTKYYENLPFVDNGVTISPDPKTWKCAKRGDTENLWLNLSDGFIGGGRKNWDGSGGSNGALDHFEETGSMYPLVVKLGTITTDAKGDVQADCFSYAKDEDGPVTIPNLVELLLKRGIKVAGLQKTEKSTAELEVELNANYAFDAITESGSKLTAVSGPGEQGLQNLGNTCYLASVVQALSSLPEVASRYGKKPGEDVTEHRFFKGITPTAAPTELLVQMTKLATALTSGQYAIPQDQIDFDGPTDPKYRLAPRMFKHLIGKDHVDFKTAQQQDAAHFLQYLLEQLDRSEAKFDREMLNTSHLFSFKTEERLVCAADKKIKYKQSGGPESIWSLRLPMEKAEMKEPEAKKQKQEDGETKTGEDEEEKKIPTLSFLQVVESWAAESSLDDYRWPHLQNTVSPTTQTTRFKNFPRYLWVQAQRYQLGPDWQPIKLEVNLDMPESIDLNAYKATGPQEGEELVPEEEDSKPAASTDAPSNTPQIDEAALSQLMDMGFNMNGCKRALMAVGGSDTESAMNWIFEHNMDPDFNDPLPEPSSTAAANAAPTAGGGSGVDDAVVMSLVESLGCFTIDQVRAALKETQGAADRAADWLFSHMDDLDGAIASLESKNNEGSSSSSTSKVPLEDGDGKYTMIGMISHIGKNTGSGHYVAHLKHDDNKWVIYNDEKVALSENPPLQHAYLYLFQRTDTIGSPNPQY